MNKALAVLNNHIYFSKDGVIEREPALIAMEKQSIRFSEWLKKEGYTIAQKNYIENELMWFKTQLDIGITTTELYNIYNNQP